jgi:hypothetical protein
MAIQLRDILDGHRYFNKRILMLEGRKSARKDHKHIFLQNVVNLVFRIHAALRSLDHPMQETDTLELTSRE